MKKILITILIMISCSVYAEIITRPDGAFVGGFDAKIISLDEGKTWEKKEIDSFIQFRGDCVIFGGTVFQCSKMVGTYAQGVRCNVFWIAEGRVMIAIAYDVDEEMYYIRIFEDEKETMRVLCLK